jgi:hypothetical protein
MAGIPISNSFTMGSALMIDDRANKKTLIERDSIESYKRVKGLQVFVEETNTWYYLKTGITNSDWDILGSSSSSGTSADSIPKIVNPIVNDIIVANTDGTVKDSGLKTTDLLDKATYDPTNIGIVKDSKKLNGQDASYYAKATDIPTKVSQLTNDSGYLASVPTGYAKINDIATTGNKIDTYSADKIINLVNNFTLIVADWTSGVNYKKYQLVDYLGTLYRLKNDITNSIYTPDISPTDYEVYSSGSGSGGSSLKFPTFSTNHSYSYREGIWYNGILYSAKSSFTSTSVFSVSDWDIICDMTRNVYDTNGDGRVDMAERALISDLALETQLMQSWRASTVYTVGQNLIFNNCIYTVNKNFTSGTTFITTNLTLTATGTHNSLTGLQGGNATSGQYYHLDQTHYDIVNKFTDASGNIAYNGTKLGDMFKGIFDKNGDNIVDVASTLDGLLSSITELNSLKGVTGNIQDKFNSLSGINLKDTHKATYSTLISATGMLKGDAYIVDADESKNGAQTWYTWNGTTWVFLGTASVTSRDFTVNPLNVTAESTGLYLEPRIDPLIARKSDIPTFSNLTLLQSYSNTDGDITNAVSQSHQHLNKTLLDSYTQSNTDLADSVNKKHVHTNKVYLDKISEASDGTPLYNGSPMGSGSSSGGGGITDLSKFTTADLSPSTNRNYVADSEKANIQNLTNIVANQSSMNTTLTTISSEIPSDVSAINKLISTTTMNDKISAMKFVQLKDVDPAIKANGFLVVDSTGTKITYLQSIKDYIQIKQITDKDGKIFNNVPTFKFDDLAGTLLGDGTLELKLKNIFSTDLKDMPTTLVNNGVLVANSSTNKYELKDVANLTNSHENPSYNVKQVDWYWDTNNNCYLCDITHNLQSINVIVGIYDSTNNIISNVFPKVVNSNSIQLKCQTTPVCRVVINCSQGTVGSSSGGSTIVTSSDFIDDTRVRSDKTYSSDFINTTLKGYAQTNQIYTQTQSNLLYATKNSEHLHNNFDLLQQLTTDSSNNLYFSGQKLLTNFQPYTYQLKWTNENKPILNTIVDVNSIFLSNSINAIMNSEFTIVNNIVSIDDTTDSKTENLVHLLVLDNTIKILDVYIKPSRTEKFILGISPNISIMVQGSNFSGLYYLTAY